MRRRTLRKILTSVSLLAFVWSVSGGAAGLVYCIGSDGHAGVEHSHDVGPCQAPRAGSSGATSIAVGGDATSLPPGPCTDLPLLSQVSTPRDDDSGRVLLSAAFATPIVARPQALPAAPAQARTLARALPFSPQRLRVQRTTVLRV